MSHQQQPIVILTCGGTIDKLYPRRAGAFAFEFAQSGSSVSKVIERAGARTADVVVERLFALDSQHVGADERQRLLQRIETLASKRIVVTHGTDTLIATAKFVDDALLGSSSCRGICVVFTGAVQPEFARESDADFNVGFALGAVRAMSLSPAAESGCVVRIGMCGRLFDPRRVVRDASGRFEEIE